ncbi:MAG: PSD1 and planctomycete cytochrome C domain-containing protein [Isosphaeraceae bacterium]
MPPALLLALALVLDLPPTAARTVDFEADVQPIFQASCVGCHGQDKQKGGLRLDVKALALKGGDNFAPAIVPGKSADSPLIQFVAGLEPTLTMPPKGKRLTPAQISLLRAWIDQGAVWPDGASAKVEDPARTHWAYQPLTRPKPPELPGSGSVASNSIDLFVAEKLAEAGLSMGLEADKRTLIRRLYLVLHGLPPSPEDVAGFLADPRPTAYEELVDRLLASPHYGERWARHWLDVIAFGETDGFEVNTPRENAWPYRDYVIQAFNSDKPYPEFIKDQLAGDTTGEDAATGFIVAKAALLPGQTGRDIESIRQARQDKLNDMVLNTGAAFLGLTLNCARCHDHKFDPISQHDYAAMTAFFAGTRHGERPLRPADSERRKREASEWSARLLEVQTQLARFEPLADTSASERTPTVPRINEETFDPIIANYVRFTIYDANAHPTLGVIAPCIDELEVFSTDNVNVALAASGTKATASGSVKGSAIHRLEHINDGRYGNSHSWISSEPGRGWVQLELPDPTPIHRIVWGRDREGKYQDRLATAYLIEAGPSLDAMRAVAGQKPLRSAVDPRLTVDRFAPLTTTRLRLTVLGTTSAEPCIDELEIFTAEPKPRNVALANAGAKASASGTYPNADIHRLEHINDGRYGNSHSWISHEQGKGWVEIEFPGAERIDRIVWSRDRAGEYSDRLATNYRIEVADARGGWKLAASSLDRQTYQPGLIRPHRYQVDRSSGADAEALDRLTNEAASIEARLADLNRTPMVYAGTFTDPEATFRLHRGDPMQPKEPVAPGSPSRFRPSLELPADAPEQGRRLALAAWIADPKNPLTARVMVNRLWQHHFGEGIVTTPSDFGINGARPVNQPLLDWLASEFIDRGWSVKAIQKQIVMSATFRQSSRPRREALAVDASTRLLWRFPPRRLDAEVIRDSILTVSGALDCRMGGPGYSAFAPNSNYVRVYNPKVDYGPDDFRRMIYQTKVRMAQDSTFGAFDCPDAGQNQPSRPRSTTPLQALNLFNSRFVVQQAERFADQLGVEAGVDPTAQVRLGFQRTVGRDPDLEETCLCVGLIESQGVPTFCRVLLNANEFLFLP